MPVHVIVSPEEDLLAWYTDPALRGPAGAVVPPEAAASPATPVPPVDGLPADAATVVATSPIAPPPPAPVAATPPEPARIPGRLAPVQRPMPTFPATPPPPAPPGPPVSPLVAAGLSALLPGAGQIYLGQSKKGGLLVALGLLTCFGVLSVGLLNLAAAGDAWLIAHRRNNGEDVGPWKFF